MRLPLGLLACITPILASQYPFQVAHPITAQSTTIVDALSADGNYTRLIRLLQKTRLIPTINRLNETTLFAPTNDAIEQNALWSAASASSDDTTFYSLKDNIQEELRQQLLYHLLNGSITDLPKDGVDVYKTLLFPQIPIEPPTRQPPPNPPWLPEPGGTLGDEPQRLRVAARNATSWVGTDYAGNSGTEVVRPIVETDNGKLIGIGGVLDPPKNITCVILEHASATYFQKILPESLQGYLASTTAVTVFLPQDSAWDELDKVERVYLESSFGEDDMRTIIDMHSVIRKGVHWSDTFKNDTKLTTANGNKLTITISSNQTNVSDATIIQPDIYASNGVVHLVSSLLIPPDTFQLTAEKHLLALNCTSFVSLLRSVSLNSLVNNTNVSYTILAPRDDVFLLLGDDKLPERGSAELSRLLKYHFLPGLWRPKVLNDGMLVETALDERGLDGKNQVLHVGVTGSDDSRELTFGEAGVIGGKPLEINNTIIYVIGKVLTPPQDALTTALPSLQFSTFLAAVQSTSLADTLRNTSSTSLLIPSNSAFEQLSLITTHLLLSSSKPDLEKVIQHHAVKEVVYMSSLLTGTQKTYATLEGSDIQIERLDDGHVYIEPSGGWKGLRGEVGKGKQDLLTRTGVIHEIASVLVPRTVEITIEKLARAAEGSTMLNLVVKAGMGWILNGTAPPADSEWANEGIKGTGWTLLCPTDSAFKGVNMSLIWDDMVAMRKLVSQHLIPGPSAGDLISAGESYQPLIFAGQATYSTLLSRNSLYGDVVFRPKSEKSSNYIVGIKDARGTNGKNDWANVVAWGRSTQGSRGGVVQIDRLLMPYEPAWWIEYGPPLLVGLVGAALMALFFVGVRALWRRDTVEATYEPAGGFEREDDDS